MFLVGHLPGVCVELKDGSPPGGVERDEGADMLPEPVLGLLLQEVQSKQSPHAVADDGDWHGAGAGVHLLHQGLQSSEVLSLRVRSKSEVVRSRPGT